MSTAHQINYPKLAHQEICSWIKSCVDNDDFADKWLPITFKIDSAVRTAEGAVHSPWSQGAIATFQKVQKALDWTITELRRYNKGLQFVAWIGGNESIGVRTHIHALIRVPDSETSENFVRQIQRLWMAKLEKSLKARIKARVWIDAKSVQCAAGYANYASRQEGHVRGTDKILMGRSFYLKA
jgi:hypothetical protein